MLPLRRVLLARRLPLPSQSAEALMLARHRGAAGGWARTLCAKAEAKPEAAAEPAADAAEAEAAPGTSEGTDGDAARVAELEAQLSELDEQLKAKHDQVLRALAEADNARRRAAIDVENASKFSVGGFAKDLLDVADNLGRAADAVPAELRDSEEAPVLKNLYEGVVLVDTVLHKARHRTRAPTRSPAACRDPRTPLTPSPLAPHPPLPPPPRPPPPCPASRPPPPPQVFSKHGLTKIEPLGEKFDPNFHNAMFEAPDPTKEPGTVMHVASPGYVMHDRCLRAAGVGVVQKPA